MQLVMLLQSNVKMIACQVSAIEFTEGVTNRQYQVMLISVQDPKLYHNLTTIKYYRTLKIHVLLILDILKYCQARGCHGTEVTFWTFLIGKAIMG